MSGTGPALRGRGRGKPSYTASVRSIELMSIAMITSPSWGEVVSVLVS